ncbi:MAG TPA: tetratricopeptide repeat protein [Candidatus Marinimicrobia bacterium]|nr:tetratricopeptide repeat protein [Candidatus Neomarinimicrobiota bacterium]HRS51847.1 tetratricopeptide repeat protein [Candidatus Neomarinimicrobiota bacterium]HRU92692.1 tetratricopeptide repeat protein [Candidatus Neomarinimicrobiota bacterium]
MNLLRTLVLIISLTVGLLAENPAELDSLFEQGNRAYQEENYPEAIRFYESIIARGYESGPLYFNLGNAYYRVNNIGHAILNYERAARLIPNDPNVAFNLQLANLSVKDRVEAPPPFFLFRWYQNFLNLLNMRGWAVIFSVLLLIATGSFAVWLNLDVRRLRHGLKSLFISSGVLSVIVALILFQQYRTQTASHFGIVLSEAVSSLSAPQAGSTELFIVHEGTKFKILDADENWIKIELIDGKQGWVPGTDVAKI